MALSAESQALADSIAKRRLGIEDVFESAEPQENFDDAPQVAQQDNRFSDETMDLAVEIATRRESESDENLRGLATEFGEGITFGFLGELVANARAAKEGIEYDQAKAEYEVAREMWKRNNP